MRKSRLSEEQIVGVLKEAEAGVPLAELCRRLGVSAVTFYRWKAKYGGLEVSEAKRLRDIAAERLRLRRAGGRQFDPRGNGRLWRFPVVSTLRNEGPLRGKPDIPMRRHYGPGLTQSGSLGP